jgi:hypothetical protein
MDAQELQTRRLTESRGVIMSRKLGEYLAPCDLPLDQRPTIKTALIAKMKIEGSGSKIYSVLHRFPDLPPDALPKNPNL